MKCPLEQCSNRDHERNSRSPHDYIGSFVRPCEGLPYVYFRSTHFGRAPELLIQRPDFRLAGSIIEYYTKRRAVPQPGILKQNVQIRNETTNVLFNTWYLVRMTLCTTGLHASLDESAVLLVGEGTGDFFVCRFPPRLYGA